MRYCLKIEFILPLSLELAVRRAPFFCTGFPGDFRLRSERNCADAARAHKRVDTCGFHPLVYLPFPLEGLAQTRDRRPLRNGGTAVGLPLRVFREIFAVHRYLTATHIGYSPQARHKVNCPKGKRRSPEGYPCRATRLSGYYGRHLRISPIHQLLPPTLQNRSP